MGGNGRAQVGDEWKELKGVIFNVNFRTSFRIETTQIGLHQTTIWDGLKREFKHDPYKLQRHQEANYLDKQ